MDDGAIPTNTTPSARLLSPARALREKARIGRASDTSDPGARVNIEIDTLARTMARLQDTAQDPAA
ncbi:MAG: hypothetical protein K2X74_19780 [Acetobacteraceae bacterium]|nr:hypothetical protein [Acetobacteraceae bacterium]